MPAQIYGPYGRADDVVAGKALVASSQKNYFIAKPSSDIFTCDKHLLSGVTLRISFTSSTNDFVVISESNKHYNFRIIEANLCVRKITIADHVLTAAEKTLLKTPAVYRYTELLPQTFLATTGIRSWSHEDIISKKLVQRMTVAMAKNQAYIGTNRTNLFNYQKIKLSKIVFFGMVNLLLEFRSQQLLTTAFTSKLWKPWIFLTNFYGMPLDNYPNRFILAFDLTSTQEDSHVSIIQNLQYAQFRFNLHLTEHWLPP